MAGLSSGTQAAAPGRGQGSRPLRTTLGRGAVLRASGGGPSGCPRPARAALRVERSAQGLGTEEERGVLEKAGAPPHHSAWGRGVRAWPWWGPQRSLALRSTCQLHTRRVAEGQLGGRWRARAIMPREGPGCLDGAPRTVAGEHPLCRTHPPFGAPCLWLQRWTWVSRRQRRTGGSCGWVQHEVKVQLRGPLPPAGASGHLAIWPVVCG